MLSEKLYKKIIFTYTLFKVEIHIKQIVSTIKLPIAISPPLFSFPPHNELSQLEARFWLRFNQRVWLEP